MKIEKEKRKLFQSTVDGLYNLLGLTPTVEEVDENPDTSESTEEPSSDDAPDLQAQLDQANATITQRDQEITDLRSQLNQQQSTLNGLVEEVKKLGNRSSKKPVETTADEDLANTKDNSPFASKTQAAIDQYDNAQN